MTRWAELIDDGRVPLPDAVATVDELTGMGGRRLALRLAGGLSIDVLPERGLDLGAVWWAGAPVAWRSPNPVDPGPSRGWEDRFLGGLLATCGPDNIGEPRAGSGQHGTHHLTPAYDVSWRRERSPDGWQVRVRGSVAHTSLAGARIVVDREVVAGTGVPAVEVVDLVRNVGDRPVGVPLLYHVNLGAPLLRPGARLAVTAERPVTREPLPQGRDPLVTPAAQPGLAPVVAEHPAVGRSRATLVGDADHPDVEVSWDLAALPRLYTWSWPASGAYVLGVEPSNAPLFGPERDLPHAGAPVLDPGQSWRSGVRIRLRTHEAAT